MLSLPLGQASFLFLRQNRQQVLPHSAHRLDAQAFLRCVHIRHVRPNGNAVKSRNLCCQQSAFQSCMDCLQLRPASVHSLIDSSQSVPQRRLLAICPARICNSDMHCLPCIDGCILHLFTQILFLLIDGTSHRIAELQSLLSKSHNTQIERCLHQPIHITTHGNNTIWQ